jgi:hypothetical protein
VYIENNELLLEHEEVWMKYQGLTNNKPRKHNNGWNGESIVLD